MSASRGLEIKGANGNTVIVEEEYFTFPDEMRCKDMVAEELAANARLIAAAPELLEACKEAVALLEKLLPMAPDKDYRAFQLSRAAIAKAGGAQ